MGRRLGNHPMTTERRPEDERGPASVGGEDLVPEDDAIIGRAFRVSIALAAISLGAS